MFLDFLLISIVGIQTAVSLFALWQHPRERTHQLYALFVFFLNIFIISVFLENRPDIVGYDSLAFFLRLDFVAGMLFIVCWRYVCDFLTGGRLARVGARKWHLFIWLLTISFAFLIALTSFIITNIRFVEEVIQFDPGIFWLPYATFLLFLLFSGLFRLARGLVQAHQRGQFLQKRQIAFFFIGSLLSFSVSLGILLIGQSLSSAVTHDISQLSLYAYMFVVVMTAYAVNAHQLFSLGHAITELVISILLIILITLLFVDPQEYYFFDNIITGVLTIVTAGFLFVRSERELKRKKQLVVVHDHLQEVVATSMNDLHTQVSLFQKKINEASVSQDILSHRFDAMMRGIVERIRHLSTHTDNQTKQHVTDDTQ